MKRKMTEQQEFEIMKLVLDKFLWIGFIVMAYGVYRMIDSQDINQGIYYLIIGVIVLLLFLVMIVKEYEIIRKKK
jgi:cell division protein FtsW (lipid II flippase)